MDDMTQMDDQDDVVVGAADRMLQMLDGLGDVDLRSLTDEQVTADLRTVGAVQAKIVVLSAWLAQVADDRALARRAGAPATESDRSDPNRFPLKQQYF